MATFYLDAAGWFNFSKFFKQDRAGILSEEVVKVPVSESDLKEENETAGGHAVIFTGYVKDSLEFLNSWGKEWGNNGKFRVKNENVLVG